MLFVLDVVLLRTSHWMTISQKVCVVEYAMTLGTPVVSSGVIFSSVEICFSICSPSDRKYGHVVQAEVGMTSY